MIKVEFKLQSANLEGIEVVEAEFTDEEIGVLKQFIAYSDRTSESRLLQNGLPAINRMVYSNCDFRMECEDYNNGDLYELLHLLRPLILDDERASFEKVRNLIAKKLSHNLVKNKLK